MNTKSLSKDYDLLQELKTITEAQSNEFITINEASEYLRLKKSYIYNLVYKNIIPFYKPNGKKLYFNKLELSKWITNSRVDTVEEYEEKLKKNKKPLTSKKQVGQR